MALEKIRPRVIDETGNYTFNNVVTTGSLISGNANIGNIIGITNLVASTTSITITGSLSTTSNISAGNIKTNNLQYANGNPWAIGSSSTPPGGSNTQVQFNTVGSFDASANFIFNTATNTLVVTNISSNGAQLSSLTASNITGQVANALVSGTVYTNAQPNITSIGILTSLDVTNNITSGNANLGNATTSNYFVGNGSLLSSIAGGNVTGQVGYAAVSNSVSGSNVVGQVTYAATANAVSGANVLGTVGQATYADTANSVAGANISGTVAQATYAGTANSVAGANVSGTVAQATFAGTANSVAGANVSGTVAQATFAGTANSVAGANVSGEVTYAATANSVAVANVSGIGNIATINKDGNVSNILYGNGVFAPISVSTGSQILNGTSNVSVASSGNVSIGVAGTAAVVTVTSTGVNIAGHLTTTANVTGTFIKGNGYYLTGVDQLAAGSADVANSIANGTSNINTPASGGNITVGIGGVGNTVIFTSTGVNIAGHLTATANVTGTFIKGNGYYLTGVDQLAAGSADVANSIANGTSNINTPASGGNITVGIGGASNTIIFTSTGVNVAGYISPSTGSGTNGIIWPSNPGGGTLDVASIKYYAVTGEQTRLEINVQNDTPGVNQDDIYFTTNSYVVVNNATEATSTSSAPFQVLGGAGVAKKLYVGGNIEAGTNFIKGNGYYLTGVDQLAAGSADIANSIANGTSNINTPIAGGNITVGIGGVGNTVIFTSTGVNISGHLTATANVTGTFIKGNGYYLTGVDQLAAGSADVANSIANGTSNINTPASGGNITVGIGGISNTIIFTSTGVNVAGYISPSVGSGTNGIIWPSNPGGGTGDVASIKYYAVTGEQTRLEINVQNDYVSGAVRDDLYFTTAGYTVVNNSTEATSTTDAPFQVLGGAGVAKKLYVGGNIEAGTNYIKGNGYYLTGVDQLAAGSADIANSIANGTSNINTPISGGNITVGIGGVANTVIFTSTGVNVAGTLNVSGNLTVNGTTTTVNSTVTRVVDPIFELGGGANGAALTTDDNKDRGLLLHYYTGATATDAFIGWDDSNAEFGVGSNVAVTSEVVTFNSYGNLRTNFILGNGYYLTGIDQLAAGSADVANSIANGTSNINTPISGGNITVSVGGVANTVVFTSTGMNVVGNITTAGSGGNLSGANYVFANYFTGNGSALSALTFGNITTFNTAGLTTDELYLQSTTRLNVTASGSAGYLFDQYGATVNPAIYVTSGQTLAFNLSVATHPFLIQTSGGANYSVGLEHVDTAGTILTTTAAQGQVAGTLYWKIPYGITGNYKYQCSAHGGMNGNIVVTDANVANVTIGLATFATTANAVAGANVSGAVSYATTANSVAGANVTGQVANALISGTVYTAAQPNITSVGTLTSLAVTANISAGNVKTDNLLYANGVAYSIGSGATVAGSNTQIQFNDSGSFGGNANLTFDKATAILTANYFTGTLTTNAQPNVTSVGTLSSLTVGNATANTIFGNGTITATGNIAFTGASVSLGSIGNISITGGAANYFLKTDGAGSLSWATPSGGVGGTGLTYTPDTAPPASGNVLGDQWFNTTTNVLYEYINDGIGSYWVDISSPSTSTNSAIAGAIVIKDEGSNISTAVSSINFVGAGVTASNVGNAVTVTVTDTLSPFLLMGA